MYLVVESCQAEFTLPGSPEPETGQVATISPLIYLSGAHWLATNVSSLVRPGSAPLTFDLIWCDVSAYERMCCQFASLLQCKQQQQQQQWLLLLCCKRIIVKFAVECCNIFRESRAICAWIIPNVALQMISAATTTTSVFNWLTASRKSLACTGPAPPPTAALLHSHS